LIEPDDVREMPGREHSGFLLDAAVCGAHDHAGLERLPRHRARPAFALEGLDAAPIERILSHTAEPPRPTPDRPGARSARLGAHPGREPDPCLAPICPDLPEEHGRTHGLNVLDIKKHGDTRETNVQAVVSILVPNEARDPYWDSLVRDLLWFYVANRK
jgi:hypothetical protein